jgi:tetratricopeptide (TPR) repeat protein
MIESAAQRLRAVSEGVTDQDTWRRFPTIMAVADHAAALCEAVGEFAGDESTQARTAAVAVLDVRQIVVHHLLYLNDHVRAVPIAEAIASGRENLMGAEHPDTLAALHDLAHAYEDGAAHSTALYYRVAAVRARNLGDDHWETLWARACAAFSYTMAGQAPEASRLLAQVLADQDRVLDPDHETVLRVRYFQAYTDIDAGQLERGIASLERLITDHERLFDEDYPETWVVKGQLARAYKVAGRTDEAIRTYREVADVQARVLTVDHPDTLITRHGLAAAYESAGRTADALAEYEWVTDRFEAVMGAGQAPTRAARSDLERVRWSLQPR